MFLVAVDLLEMTEVVQPGCSGQSYPSYAEFLLRGREFDQTPQVSGFARIMAICILCLYIYPVSLEGAASSGVSGPKAINIGALATFDSFIGRAAVPAIQAAVSDINAHPDVLSGMTLNLIMRDTNCSGFVGVIEALELFESDVFAIIGPQSSGIAHIVSFAANELHTPLLSFGATDPTLSTLENEYFVRTIQNDYFQMHATAELVNYFGWNDVIAIYTDDDCGRNGIAALEDTMTLKNGKISYKAALSPKASPAEVSRQLVRINLMESRVYVVHVNPDSGLTIFSAAEALEMLSNGYVWIATDWLATVLDSTEPNNHDIMSSLQGVVAFRHHTPDSNMKNDFKARWNNLKLNQTMTENSDFNSYALYAYDSVWLAATALELFLEEGGSLSFTPDPYLGQTNGSTLNLSSLRIFNGGEQFLKTLVTINFTGMIGTVQFDSDRNMMNPAYDILNIGGTGLRTIGYWSNHSGLSSVSPEKYINAVFNDADESTSSRNLSSVIWPGGLSTTPRGWVFPNNGEALRIAVPYRISYTEFVSKVNNTIGVEGFCIDIFEAAISLLPYPVPHIYEMFGDGTDNPVYDDLVYNVYRKKYDAAVGDITIGTNRTKIVDFTQPYMEAGLVIIVPIKVAKSNAWAFLQPFTKEMWCVTAAFFFFVGIVVWLLEHRKNSEFRGSPRQQIITICWFSLSTMFFAHRENTVSAMGRLVLIIWLFVVLIINSSYTASLTSILTVQQLTTGIQGIDTLIGSTDSIGVQGGSFASKYLMDELRISSHRLRELETPDEYADALLKGPKHGGVAAIVDELPYVQLFLSKTDCKFQIVGQAFTKSGWGFAFPKDSPLAVDLSTAILQLSENGQLQKIRDKWLTTKDCTLQVNSDTSQLTLNSFWGLFLICGAVCCVALVSFFIKVCMQYRKFTSEADDKSVDQMPSEPGSSRRASRTASLKDVIYFVDKKEEEVLEALKRKSSFTKSEGRINIDHEPLNMNSQHT